MRKKIPKSPGDTHLMVTQRPNMPRSGLRTGIFNPGFHMDAMPQRVDIDQAFQDVHKIVGPNHAM